MKSKTFHKKADSYIFFYLPPKIAQETAQEIPVHALIYLSRS
jgi:hypothetical protein